VAAAHDEEFAGFMRDCAHWLYRVGYLLTADRGRAEELTQDALARAYAAWPRVRRDDAYLYTRRILVNLHNDWWRGRLGRERLVAQVPDRPSAHGDPATDTVRRAEVARAMQTLTRRERSVLVYRYFLDLTEEQTARELGIAVGTVKSTASRALAKLRAVPGLLVAEGVA
jgi:RNA polymerase sigma-70 factor (sigma-E family)